jgi:hypothetical protein
MDWLSQGGAWGGGLPGSAVDARVWSGGSNARVAPLRQARLPLGVGRKSSRRAAATRRAVELSPNLVPSSTALDDQDVIRESHPGLSRTCMQITMPVAWRLHCNKYLPGGVVLVTSCEPPLLTERPDRIAHSHLPVADVRWKWECVLAGLLKVAQRLAVHPRHLGRGEPPPPVSAAWASKIASESGNEHACMPASQSMLMLTPEKRLILSLAS